MVRNRWIWLWVVPALGYLVVFFLIPLVKVMSSQVGDAYGSVLASSFYRDSLVGSVKLSVMVSALAMLLALPIGSMVSRMRSKTLRSVVYVIIVSPVLTSAVVRAFGWLILFSSSGPINSSLAGLGIISEPIKMLYTYPATVVAVLHVLLPFAILPVVSAYSNLDQDLRRAAEVLGAGGIRIFASVTWPQVRTGALTGGLIVFSLAMGDYVTPVLVGGSTQPIAAVQAFVQYQQVGNSALSAALGTYILALVLVAVGAGVWRLRTWERATHG